MLLALCMRPTGCATLQLTGVNSSVVLGVVENGIGSAAVCGRMVRVTSAVGAVASMTV